MKLFWKIALSVVAVVLLAGAGGFLWLMFKPNAPARLAAAGPAGTRVVAGNVFGNYYQGRSSSAARAAVLILGGSEGGLSSEVAAEARLLQQHGFNTLQLAYFNAPGKGSKLERVPLEQFYQALDWLKRQPGTDADRLGIVGYSKGAEAALLVATRYPRVKAIVLGMPSNVAWDALSMRSYLFGGISSWTEGGKDIPSLAYARPDANGSLLSRFANALRDLPSTSPARLPVEKYRGAVLMICGARDTLWPSCSMAQAIARRAADKNGVKPELVVYPAAGHGVMGPPMAASDPRWRGWSTLGGTVHANVQARKDSWPRIVAFLDRTLN